LHIKQIKSDLFISDTMSKTNKKPQVRVSDSL
jgi:hypothetical protein